MMTNGNGAQKLEDKFRFDRDTLFKNEQFFIGMLQAVALASVFGIVSQSSELETLLPFSNIILPVIVTLLVVSLMFAVQAAHHKYNSNEWENELNSSMKQYKSACDNRDRENITEEQREGYRIEANHAFKNMYERIEHVFTDRKKMRDSVSASRILLQLAYVVLLLALWVKFII